MPTLTKAKWLRVVALIGAFALVMAACGKSSPKETESGGTGTTASKQLGPVPGFDGTTIKIGVVTPLTGAVKILADPLNAGQKAYYDALNAAGGVAGKYKIETVIVDSKYDQQTGVQQYNAIKDQVVLFGQLLGTPIVKGALPSMKVDKVVAQPASLDADWIHEPNLIPIGAPYQIEAINAMAWYLSDGGGQGKKICFAGHDDPYGDAGLAGYTFAAQKLGFTSATVARFKATDTDFTTPVQQLQSAGCQAVFLTATPSTSGGIMGKAAAVGYAPKWIGQFPSYISAFLKSPLLPYLKANYVVAFEGTEWGDTSVAGMKDMLDALAKFAPSQQPDVYFAVGYAGAWAVTQVLEKAVALGDLSRDGILNALQSIDVMKTGGLLGEFKYGPAKDRQPPRATTIFSIDESTPAGLKVLKKDIVSQAATDYVLPG
jgi:ABC-type branched-subunit amino acid transport system substrate-binding protein